MATLTGPSLLELVRLLKVDIKTFGVVFTGSWFGYMSGSIASGILYDRMNPELLFIMATLAMGVITMCLPWIPIFPLYVALTFFQNIGMGMIDAGQSK